MSGFLPQFPDGWNGEPRCTVPGWTPVASRVRWLEAHTCTLSGTAVAAAIGFQSLVSIRLPGDDDKFHSPQRWQLELFLEQRVVGVSLWQWLETASQAGEVPYRDGAGPSSFTRPGTERPPGSPAAPALSPPSIPSQADLP